MEEHPSDLDSTDQPLHLGRRTMLHGLGGLGGAGVLGSMPASAHETEGTQWQTRWGAKLTAGFQYQDQPEDYEFGDRARMAGTTGTKLQLVNINKLSTGNPESVKDRETPSSWKYTFLLSTSGKTIRKWKYEDYQGDYQDTPWYFGGRMGSDIKVRAPDPQKSDQMADRVAIGARRDRDTFAMASAETMVEKLSDGEVTVGPPEGHKIPKEFVRKQILNSSVLNKGTTQTNNIGVINSGIAEFNYKQRQDTYQDWYSGVSLTVALLGAAPAVVIGALGIPYVVGFATATGVGLALVSAANELTDTIPKGLSNWRGFSYNRPPNRWGPAVGSYVLFDVYVTPGEKTYFDTVIKDKIDDRYTGEEQKITKTVQVDIEAPSADETVSLKDARDGLSINQEKSQVQLPNDRAGWDFEDYDKAVGPKPTIWIEPDPTTGEVEMDGYQTNRGTAPLAEDAEDAYEWELYRRNDDAFDKDWEFVTDGTGPVFTPTIEEDGEYKAVLTVSDTNDNYGTTEQRFATDNRPRGGLTVKTDTPTTDSPVEFEVTRQHDITIDGCRVTFGDGTEETGIDVLSGKGYEDRVATISHPYSLQDDKDVEYFDVKLEMQKNGDWYTVDVTTVEVKRGDGLQIKQKPAAPRPGQTVEFYTEPSYDDYSWSLVRTTDGSELASGEDSLFTHTFDEAGAYEVELSVYEEGSEEPAATTTRSVQVTENGVLIEDFESEDGTQPELSDDGIIFENVSTDTADATLTQAHTTSGNNALSVSVSGDNQTPVNKTTVRSTYTYSGSTTYSTNVYDPDPTGLNGSQNKSWGIWLSDIESENMVGIRQKPNTPDRLLEVVEFGPYGEDGEPKTAQLTQTEYQADQWHGVSLEVMEDKVQATVDRSDGSSETVKLNTERDWTRWDVRVVMEAQTQSNGAVSEFIVDDFAFGRSGDLQIEQDPADPSPGQTVLFSTGSTYDTYSWSLIRTADGREQVASGEGSEFSYSFEDAGSYEIELAVYEDGGEQPEATTSKPVQVGNGDVLFRDDWEDGTWQDNPAWTQPGETDDRIEVIDRSTPADGTTALRLPDATSSAVSIFSPTIGDETDWSGAWTLRGLFYTESVPGAAEDDPACTYHDLRVDAGDTQFLLSAYDPYDEAFEPVRLEGASVEDSETVPGGIEEGRWYQYELSHDGEGQYTAKRWLAGEGPSNGIEVTATGSAPESAGSILLYASGNSSRGLCREAKSLTVDHAFVELTAGSTGSTPPESSRYEEDFESEDGTQPALADESISFENDPTDSADAILTQAHSTSGNNALSVSVTGDDQTPITKTTARSTYTYSGSARYSINVYDPDPTGLNGSQNKSWGIWLSDEASEATIGIRRKPNSPDRLLELVEIAPDGTTSTTQLTQTEYEADQWHTVDLDVTESNLVQATVDRADGSSETAQLDTVTDWSTTDVRVAIEAQTESNGAVAEVIVDDFAVTPPAIGGNDTGNKNVGATDTAGDEPTERAADQDASNDSSGVWETISGFFRSLS